MFEYIVFFIFFLLVAFLDVFKSVYINKYKNIWYFLTWLLLVTFIGLRYKMANDWYNYLELTKKIEPLNLLISGNASEFANEISTEWGFKFLISCINLVFDSESGNSLQALTLTISIFNYTSLLIFVKNESSIRYKFLFISTFIGFTMFREFDVLRQSIAFYLFLLSSKYIGKKNGIYVLFVLLGSLFHSSSFVFLPLYWFYKSKFSKKFILFLLVLHSLSMFIKFSLVSAILTSLGSYFPDLILVQKVYMYATEIEGNNTLSLVNMLYAIYLILIILNYSDYKNENLSKTIYFNCFFIFIIVNVLFSDSKEIADRFSYYFYFGLAFVFVHVISYFPKKLIVPYIFLVLSFPLIRFSRVIKNADTKSVLVPYRNYLYVKKSDEELILSNWQNKNEKVLK